MEYDIYATTIKTSLLKILRVYRYNHLNSKRKKKRKSNKKRKKKKINIINSNIFNDASCRNTKIIDETCNFLKLYCLKLYDKKYMPNIDDKLLGDIINAVCCKFKNEELKNFYNDHYAKTLPDNHVIPNKDGLSKFLEYSREKVLTNINTNIAEHYVEHLSKLLFELFERFQIKKKKKNDESENTKKENEAIKVHNKKISDDINKMKECLLNIDHMKNFDIYYDKSMFNNPSCYYWLKINHKKFLPKIKDYEYKNNNVKFNIATKGGAIPYLSCMIHINQIFEILNNIELLDSLSSKNTSDLDNLMSEHLESLSEIIDYEEILKNDSNNYNLHAEKLLIMFEENMIQMRKLIKKSYKSLCYKEYHQYIENKSNCKKEYKRANIKLFNVLPLCSSLIPQYITLTTTSLVSLFKPKHLKGLISLGDIKKCQRDKVYNSLSNYKFIDKTKLLKYLKNSSLGIKYFAGNLITNEQEEDIKNIILKERCLNIYDYAQFIDKKIIWSKIFNLDKSFFNKNNREFAYYIETDGIACSVLFHKKVKKDENIVYIQKMCESIKPSFTNIMKDHLNCSINENFGDKSNFLTLPQIKKDINKSKNNILKNLKSSLVKEFTDKINDKEYLSILLNKINKNTKKVGGQINKILNIKIKNIQNKAVENDANFVKKQKKSNKKTKKVKLSIKEDAERYIEDPYATKCLENKNYVVIDPNKTNLMYCLFHKNENIPNNDKPNNNENIKRRTLIYSQGHRKRESGQNDVRKRIEKLKSSLTNGIDFKSTVSGKKSFMTIKEIESELCGYTKMTGFYDSFKNYLIVKNNTNESLRKFYESPIFRILRWHIKIRTQISESNFLNNFKKKFGSNEETVVIIGDYSCKNHMKGKSPAISKRIRKIFDRGKYMNFLIDEFRTSKLCNRCVIFFIYLNKKNLAH